MPTTGVIPRGQDLYTVTRQGGSAFVSTDSLQAAALKEAGEYCDTHGQRFVVVHTKEHPSRSIETLAGE